ncbi:MAG: hypothetical protein KGZ83_20965 [Sulfuricella sp.]|nr:hypothetical protein [Sulfuricella sp.]
MKFTDLPIHARFELEGAIYRKTSPMLASPENGGAARFLARFVQVVPLDGQPRPAPAASKELVRADDVLAAFDVCYAGVTRKLEQDGLPDLRAALEAGREEFIAALAGLKKT